MVSKDKTTLTQYLGNYNHVIEDPSKHLSACGLEKEEYFKKVPELYLFSHSILLSNSYYVSL